MIMSTTVRATVAKGNGPYSEPMVRATMFKEASRAITKITGEMTADGWDQLRIVTKQQDSSIEITITGRRETKE